MGLRVRYPWESAEAGIVLDGRDHGSALPGAPSAVFEFDPPAGADPRREAMDAMTGQLRAQGVSPERAVRIAQKAAIRHERNNP